MRMRGHVTGQVPGGGGLVVDSNLKRAGKHDSLSQSPNLSN